MQLLADENQHPRVVQRLRAIGYLVEWIRESSLGSEDEDILSRPDIGGKILLTYDRDFGDLIFNRGYPAPWCILYTRMNRAAPDAIADRLIAILEAGIEAGHITTILQDGTRSKPFPSGAVNA